MNAIIYPTISVVIPFRNAEESILCCLESLSAMNYPQDKLEIIAINDDRDTATAEIVSQRFPSVILILNGTTHGCNATKEIGTNAATGSIIAYTDADCTVDNGWAIVIAKTLSSEVAAVTGPVRHPKTFLSELVAVADFSDFQSNEYQSTSAFVGCNYAINGSFIKDFNLPKNNMRFGGDRIISWRIHSEGHKIIYNPNMIVNHFPKVDINNFFERRMRYGKKALLIRRIDPTLPGGTLVKLGLLAPFAYMGYKFLKDIKGLFGMSKQGLLNGLHVPFLLPALMVARLIDSISILIIQCKKHDVVR
ncbi:MAG: glycosyltransferase family 2 protein [Armatimonadota bacterium]